jgi:protein phosphatase-4 regulatory subunit 3
MTVFFENGDRYNLLNSAVLDIMDYVRKESLKMLVDHLVEHFGHRFDDVDYVDTLRALRLKVGVLGSGGGGFK